MYGQGRVGSDRGAGPVLGCTSLNGGWQVTSMLTVPPAAKQVAVTLVKQRLEMPDCAKGWLLDG